jgi:sugar lactone lactonase YvrE
MSRSSTLAAVGPKARPISRLGRYLVWSDVPNDRMLRYDETDGHISIFRQPSAFSSGNAVDREGHFVTGVAKTWGATLRAGCTLAEASVQHRSPDLEHAVGALA